VIEFFKTTLIMASVSQSNNTGSPSSHKIKIISTELGSPEFFKVKSPKSYPKEPFPTLLFEEMGVKTRRPSKVGPGKVETRKLRKKKVAAAKLNCSKQAKNVSQLLQNAKVLINIR
jgi:hypothetical protein